MLSKIRSHESDDPSVTAPFLYEEIKRKQGSELFKEILLHHPEWNISSNELERIDTEIAHVLNQEYASLKDPGVERLDECMHCTRMAAGELLVDNVDTSLDKKPCLI